MGEEVDRRGGSGTSSHQVFYRALGRTIPYLGVVPSMLACSLMILICCSIFVMLLTAIGIELALQADLAL